jgi:mRNA interferase YafQ
MKYSILRTGQFKKDYKSAKKRGKDLQILLTVVENLANGVKLEDK